MTDEPAIGIQRVTVDASGERHFEVVGPDDPLLGPLSAIVKARLVEHFDRRTLGVGRADLDEDGLAVTSFSIAEEVDFYFRLELRPAADHGEPDGTVDRPELGGVADTVEGQLHSDLLTELLGPAWDRIDRAGIEVVSRSIAAAIDASYIAVPRFRPGVDAADRAHERGRAVIVLGVRRSGTTLLRVMLDRNPELAIPDESYFVPQLARRHGRRVRVSAFVDDLQRLPTLVEWGLSPDQVAARLRPRMATGDAIAAVFEAYAAAEGKSRWGDKTPLYMQHLPLLERLFPAAQFVHLIRDGRDAALSFLSVPPGIMTEGWAQPRDAAGFACQWATEVRAARALGARVGSARYLELRYEALVAEPEAELRRICAFAGLEYDATMLGYVGETDSARKEHQQRLNEPPRVGVRNWQSEMSPDDVAAFESVAGHLLHELGYDVTTTGRDRRRLAVYAVKTSAWRSVGALTQRSPLWRRRHPPVG